MPIPFRPIARLLTHALRTHLQVYPNTAESIIPAPGMLEHGKGLLITVNHYSAPDFPSWWSAILVSAFYPANIHWVVTAGWTNSGWLTGFTHWLFPRGARLLGFTPMPAMPPDPREVEQRAASVRSLLKYARATSHPVIGLAPEGGDAPGGGLGPLPPGAGRFIHLLSQYCPLLLPVGVWTDSGRIILKFGGPYSLDVPDGLSAHERDLLVGKAVMHQIALLLPDRLGGGYL
jgi:hypothetical protein